MIRRVGNDIGYNFLVTEQGRIYEDRYSRQYPAGTHAEGANTGSVRVACVYPGDENRLKWSNIPDPA